jgi:hypothetical protein
MSLDDFTEKIIGMVSKWNCERSELPKVKTRLAEIYAEVRNSTAFELATAQRQRDEALRRLHRKIVLDGELVPRRGDEANP